MTSSPSVAVVVLAAGAGTRMRSPLPKPLHEVAGTPMVLHVIDALRTVQPAVTVVVVGHGADQMRAVVAGAAPEWTEIRFAHQHEQRGTGHATAIGLDALRDTDDIDTVLVVPGDTPLLTAETMADVVRAGTSDNAVAAVLTSSLDDPTGYGRVVRSDDGSSVVRIVEHRDATTAELAIREWNAGVYVMRRDLLHEAVQHLTTDNAQGELYLTDVIAAFAAAGHRVAGVHADATEVSGVNDPDQLAAAEAAMLARHQGT